MESVDDITSSSVSLEKLDLEDQLPPELVFIRQLDRDLKPLACKFIKQGAAQLLANNLDIKLINFPNKKGKARKFMADPAPFFIEFVSMPVVPSFLAQMIELLKMKSTGSTSTPAKSMEQAR
eukprot:CAMPEP_0113950318 /NCGR_PEP_ID=MMETSP1339-20121228/80293_1 /TAXON_ID=94617 /ORGANISM="Fibrocapsa japonica" /LENGTH=121 /DNA_ID=CAMNT_0000958121 /DNA_START=43 /DNA_END=404 /DNA_ORIENTATION=- /assembly_acc=CAM_ASM_000762